jgi:glycosyltransferase involved in cell wall biosynthesis
MANLSSIVIPCFNEEGNIPILVADLLGRIEQADVRAEIILVDDGSTDGTWNSIVTAAREHSRVRGISQMRNYGQSLAYQAGIERSRGDYVILYSGDNEIDSKYLLDVLAKLDEGWDFVNTRRVGRWHGDNRAQSSKLGNKVINFVSGLDIQDRGSGLKGMKAEIAKSIRFCGEMHRFIPDYASLHTQRILEIETDFRDRSYGKSAYAGKLRSLSVFLDIITLAYLLHSAKRPFLLSPGRVFGFSGMIIGAVASMSTLWLVMEKILLGSALADRPLFLISALSMILGVIMVMLGVTGEMLLRVYNGSGSRKTHLHRADVGIDNIRQSDEDNF